MFTLDHVRYARRMAGVPSWVVLTAAATPAIVSLTASLRTWLLSRSPRLARKPITIEIGKQSIQLRGAGGTGELESLRSMVRALMAEDLLSAEGGQDHLPTEQSRALPDQYKRPATDEVTGDR
jgi:hypothetical protein